MEVAFWYNEGEVRKDNRTRKETDGYIKAMTKRRERNDSWY